MLLQHVKRQITILYMLLSSAVVFTAFSRSVRIRMFLCGIWSVGDDDFIGTHWPGLPVSAFVNVFAFRVYVIL